MKLLICAILIISLFIVIPAFGVGSLVGKGCIVSWTANTESDLAGYKLYIGTATGSYGPSQVILAPAASITCAGAGITTDGQYYITLTAYDKTGNESGKTTEVPFTLDGTMPVVPSGLKVQ